MTVPSLDDIRELAAQLRVDSIRCSTAAGSGHLTSSMSAADVMAVLLSRHLRYDWQRPDDLANDHLIFSTGTRRRSCTRCSRRRASSPTRSSRSGTGGSAHGWRATPTPVLPWDVAPSDELRKWYGHDPERFEEFGRRYRVELQGPRQAEALSHLRGRREAGDEPDM